MARFTIVWLLYTRGDLDTRALADLLERDRNVLHHHLRRPDAGFARRERRRIDGRKRSFYALTIVGEHYAEPLYDPLKRQKSAAESTR
ncbi:hypothetical protein ACFQPA_03140 [Halomarina halobia]|uniref:ArsR family transcriptional regulator n=1 Tax=Halomarina halobia TaxID=3033386 RepID=A0ABD6A5E4_9EURY|nr:hypothetical protein [Halomarina sp. PSR21]